MLQREYNFKCRVDGLQYDGIKFQAVPSDETPGEAQYVRLIWGGTTSRTEPDWAGSSVEVANEALDGCYPFPLNLPPYGTKDTPGFTSPITLFARSFTIDLMFRPSGEGNEWVPLKVYSWNWQGAITCDTTGCREDKSQAVFPMSGNGADADEYPEWDICSETGR